MSSNGTPQIAVRLTPEGVADVIEAFRRVTAEGKKLEGNNTSKDVGLLNVALRDLKRLIPTIGIATVVGGFLAMSRSALKAAEDTGKLQQSFGGLVEEISGLTLAFRLNKSDQAGLQQALAKTSTLMAQVRNGGQEARDALASIGLDSSVANLTTPRALEAIAKKLVSIEDPAKRSAAAIAIFRDRTGQLLPALNAVGREGIDQFVRKAREMGVLIGDDFTAAASRANDALAETKILAEGMATQFSIGLAPAVADAMGTFNDAVTGGGEGMITFGKVIGFVVRLVTTLFVSMGKTIGAVVAGITTSVGTSFRTLRALVTGDLKGALAELKSGAIEILSIKNELMNDQFQLGVDLATGPKEPPKKPDGGGDGDAEAIELLRKQNQTRLQLRQQQIRLELQLQQELLKAEEEAAKQLYEANLTSLQRYFDTRLDIIKRNGAAELAALQKERALLQGQLSVPSTKGGPDDEQRAQLRQQLAQIDAQIRVEQIRSGREIAALDAERAAGLKSLNDELAAQNVKLLEAEGNRHAVFQANLAQEIKLLRELGVRAGQSAAEIEAEVQRLTSARTNQFNFDEVTRKAKEAFASFNRDAEQIRRDQQAGIITQTQGVERLIELERQRLAGLQAIAQQALLAAQLTGNPEAIEQAQQYADSVAQIAASYQQATDVLAQFRSAGIEAVGEDVVELFDNIDKIKSVGDAFNKLADTVKSALADIAQEIIRRQIVLALARAIPGGFGLPGAQSGGRIRGMAAGGDVRGAKLPIAGPDKIPILAQEGEFMMRKARVDEPGALSFLRAWNSGHFTLAQAMRLPHFAGGGMIGGIAAQTTAPVGGGAMRVEQSFSFPGQRGERVSRLTLMQVQAAAAEGLAEAARRNN